jgi:hypothetical protein
MYRNNEKQILKSLAIIYKSNYTEILLHSKDKTY